MRWTSGVTVGDVHPAVVELQEFIAAGHGRWLIGYLFSLPAVFQSKDIGIQMHEELVKVTNELYTVSNPQYLLQIDPSRIVSGF